MPRLAVELEYLVPVWTTVVVEADDENHAKAAAYAATAGTMPKRTTTAALVPRWSGGAS